MVTTHYTFAHFHPRLCPECGNDLADLNAIEVHFVCAGQAIRAPSFVYTELVDDFGWELRDVDRLVEMGFHAGSYCAKCAEHIPTNTKVFVEEPQRKLAERRSHPTGFVPEPMKPSEDPTDDQGGT